MKFIAKIIVAIGVNSIAIFSASKWVDGFELNTNFEKVLIIASILTALNFTVKPILKLILAPIIVLTLGIGLIVVNALILYFLDFFSEDISILTTNALIYSSLITGIGNFVFHIATKK